MFTQYDKKGQVCEVLKSKNIAIKNWKIKKFNNEISGEYFYEVTCLVSSRYFDYKAFKMVGTPRYEYAYMTKKRLCPEGFKNQENRPKNEKKIGFLEKHLPSNTFEKIHLNINSNLTIRSWWNHVPKFCWRRRKKSMAQNDYFLILMSLDPKGISRFFKRINILLNKVYNFYRNKLTSDRFRIVIGSFCRRFRRYVLYSATLQTRYFLLNFNSSRDTVHKILIFVNKAKISSVWIKLMIVTLDQLI